MANTAAEFLRKWSLVVTEADRRSGLRRDGDRRT